MKHTILSISIAASFLVGCDNKPPEKFEPVDAAPQSPTPAPVQSYAERVRNEIRSVQGSPVDLPASAASSAASDGYQADLWLSNTDMAAGLAKRLVQDVVLTARLYPELMASADNGKLAREVLDPLFSPAVHTPRIRTHLSQVMDNSSLRLANEGAKSSLLRRFIIEHSSSFGDSAAFEAFLRKPPEFSRWRSDAIASVAYATSFPTIEQAALSVLPKILTKAGRTLSQEDLSLVDKRAGALSFSRVAYGLRGFSDMEVYQLQQLLASEPQTRKAFEQTAIVLFQSLTGGASQPTAGPEPAGATPPVAASSPAPITISTTPASTIPVARN